MYRIYKFTKQMIGLIKIDIKLNFKRSNKGNIEYKFFH